MKEEEKEKTRNQDWAALAVRLFVSSVFLISAYIKLLEPAEEFAAAIEAYKILPSFLLLPFAKIVPWFELFAGGFLLAGYLTRLSAAAAGILSSMFFIALASVKLRGIPLDSCGCFGSALPDDPWKAMFLDVVLIAASAYLLKRKTSAFSLDNWTER
ncbi:MAG: DoxX family membrane protein [Elusimicrobia bacterium]|nr:DoxX family membrane protein [Elusimicrobiota bacterium]